MKNMYKFVVVETVKRWVEIEAETQEEAEEMALDVDMEKNPDFYEREAVCLETVSLDTVDGCPKYVNGWNLECAENMTYWKNEKDFFVAVCLYWLDTVEGDEGYNPEQDSWVILKAYGDTLEEAIESLDFMPMTISDVMPKKDAAYTMIEWFKSQEG